MPRKTAAFIPDTTGKDFIPLDQIPDDIKELIEGMLTQTGKTNGRTRLEYDTEDELKLEFRQMASYAAQRPSGIGGVLKIRRSPTRDLPGNVMDVRVSKDVVANGEKEGARNSRRNH